MGLTSLPARKPGLSDLHVRGAGLSEKQLQAGECVLRNLASNKTLFLARWLQLKRSMDKASSDQAARRYHLAGVLLNRVESLPQCPRSRSTKGCLATAMR